MKKKTKIIIAGASVATIAATIGGTVILTSATNKVADVPEMPNTVAVERMDLENKVSLSGTVKSADITTVKCSVRDAKVKSVNVRVGDEVKKGDIIAVLDDSSLQEKLAEAKALYKNTKAKNDITLSAADRNCESTISASDRSIKDADRAVYDAQRTYDDAAKKDNDIYKEYLEALENKNKAYEKFKPYEKKDKKDDKFEKEEKEKAYNDACDELTKMENKLSEASEKKTQAEIALRDALGKYENAREEVSKQKALRQEAETKLMNAQAAAANAEEDGEATPAAAVDVSSLSSYDQTVATAEKLLREAEMLYRDAQKTYDSAVKDYNKVSGDRSKAADEKNSAYNKYKEYLGNDGSEKGIELEQKYNEAKDKLEQKEKELKEANEKFEDARDELNRQKELRSDAVAKKDKDRADIEGSLDSTKLTADEDVKKQKKDIEKIKEDIEKCTIRATADGVITSLNVKEEDTFDGGEVAVIQDADKFIISANADQYEISNIEKGMTTRITVSALNGSVMEGTLSYAAPTPDTKESQGEQTIEYPIESEITDPVAGLRLGMTAKLEIISEEKYDVLAVPDECIQIGENGEYYVEAVDETGAISQITVNYGMKSDYYSEIEGAGITEGMQIVMPEQQIEPDMGAMMLF